MELTQRQLDVLNHVVVNGQEWADNAKQESHILDKIARWESDYDEAIAKGNYKNRKQRDDVDAKERQDEYDNVPYSTKRRRDYPVIGDQLDALYHAGAFPEDMTAKINAVKDEFPKE